MLHIMGQLGNTRANRIWLGSNAPPEEFPSSAELAQRALYIRSKYEAREFLGVAPPPHALHDASLRGDVELAAACLAHGVSPDAAAPSLLEEELEEGGGVWRVETAAEHGGRTALQISAALGHEGMVEFLLLNGAAVDSKDGGDFRSALELALAADHGGCAKQLLKRGATQRETDPPSMGGPRAAQVQPAAGPSRLSVTTEPTFGRGGMSFPTNEDDEAPTTSMAQPMIKGHLDKLPGGWRTTKGGALSPPKHTRHSTGGSVPGARLLER